MNIILYYNRSERNKLGKSLTHVETLTGSLKRECDLLNPVITVEHVGPITANYAFIPEFGAYYFIAEPGKSIINNIWELSLKKDVLESAKTQLLNMSALIARQENNYNPYLTDNLVPMTNDTKQLIKKFDNGMSFDDETTVVYINPYIQYSGN